MPVLRREILGRRQTRSAPRPAALGSIGVAVKRCPRSVTALDGSIVGMLVMSLRQVPMRRAVHRVTMVVRVRPLGMMAVVVVVRIVSETTGMRASMLGRPMLGAIVNVGIAGVDMRSISARVSVDEESLRGSRRPRGQEEDRGER